MFKKYAEFFRKNAGAIFLSLGILIGTDLTIGFHRLIAQTAVPTPTVASGVVTGSFNATSGSVTIPVTPGQATVTVSITGTFTAALTIRGSVDYASVGAANAIWGTTTAVALSNGAIVTGITGTGIFQINASGFSAIQVFGTNVSAGTVNVAGLASAGVSGVMADNTFPSILTSLYPQGATPVANSNSGTTAAISATLPAAVNKTTFICGFEMDANATAATFAAANVGNTISTMNFLEPIAAIPGVGVLQKTFTPCLPAASINSTITVNTGAPGAGGNNTVFAWGYQQ